MTCALCRKNKKLCKSHIIPEFLFKSLYDPKHRALKLLSDKSKKFIQKGLRDSLLCKKCEGHIARYIETPFDKQWGSILPSYHSDPLLKLTGLDYTVTKLMILTNLWRAHCSDKKDWKNVKLGPYADKIAKMIQNVHPGNEKEFPIWGELIVDDDNFVRCDIITPFSKSRPNGHYIYYSAHGGIDWYITVSPTCKTVSKDVYLTQDGTMVLLKKHILECSSIKSFRRSKV